MLLTLIVLRRRGDVDRVPPSTPLSQFPRDLDQRTATDIPLDAHVLELLGQGVFLNRTYAPQASPNYPDISLFIGYFPTQRTGQSIHSPQNCLPGAGWTFESSGLTEVTDAAGHRSQVGDYTITDGGNRAEVLYWYESHGRSIASDYKAKLYMLADSIRYSRSDAALVRVVTPLRTGEDPAVAHERATAFVAQLMPLLPAYIPN
jgi:EpsI family protein